MARPLKVLFLLEDLCYGGTQKQTLALARHLDRQRFSPTILTLTGPTDLDQEALDIPLWHLGQKRRLAPFFFLQLPGAIASIKPDILVACTALPNIWGRIWGRLLQVPVIVGTCRGGGAPARQHEWLLWRLASGMVCNSQALCRIMQARGLPQSRLRYIANGVDTEHFKTRHGESGGCLILNVARLAKDKDHLTLLAAFGMIAAEFPTARLRIVGEGPQETALREFCRNRLEPEHAARVEFTGACADPGPHYEAADIFALSSVREGQPNVIIEAMSSGLPVCATNVGGIPDLVTDNGLLSAPGNAEEMAGNLRRLLGHRSLREEMGLRGRLRTERDFSFKKMAADHEAFFEYLWAGKKR